MTKCSLPKSLQAFLRAACLGSLRAACLASLRAACLASLRAACLALLGLCSPLFPQTLQAQSGDITYEHRSIRFVLYPSQENGKDIFLLEGSVPQATRAEAFTLENPKRLVIDFFGVRGGPHATLYAAADSPIPSLRLGVHPDKLRMVLDLRFSNTPVYSWKLTNGAVWMKILVPGGFTAEERAVLLKTKTAPAPLPVPYKIGDGTSKQEGKKEETVPALTPRLSEVPLQKSIPATPPPATLIPPVTPTLIPGGMKEKAASALDVPHKLRLSAIEFQRSGEKGQGKLRLQVRGSSKFSLIRQSPKSYMLTIFDCGVDDPRLELPYFPPADFTGLQMVQALVQKDGLHVLINVDEGTTLSAQTDQHGILVGGTASLQAR